MRLLPGDLVPSLSVFAEEMRGVWMMPVVPRAHRDRLAALVGHAVSRFDPRVRLVQLRWVERRLLEEGRLRLPEVPLLWWRIEAGTRAADVLREAPQAARGIHLFDFDGDPGVVSLGWLGHLKVELHHRITDVLTTERPIDDVEPVLDKLDDAAERLVSPIDLLDFTERLLETRAAGLPIDQAEADAYAVLIANRFAPDAPSRDAANAFVASLEAAARDGDLPDAARRILAGAGLVEPGDGARAPLLEVLDLPRGTDGIEPDKRVIDQVAWRVGGVRGTPLPASKLPPPMESAPDPRSETEAERVLNDLRAGRDRDWTAERRRAAAEKLLVFAEETKRSRGEKRTPSLLEREATLLQMASGQFEELGDLGRAASAAIAAADLWMDAYRPGEATEAAERGISLARKLGQSSLTGAALRARGEVRLHVGDPRGAREDLDAAVASLEEGPELARAWMGRAWLRTFEGDLAGAEVDVRQAFRLFEALEDRAGQARALDLQARVLLRQDDFLSAAGCVDAGLALATTDDEIGSARAWLLHTRAGLHMLQNRRAAAASDLDAALHLFEQSEDRRGRANVLTKRAALRRDQGNLVLAAADIELAILLFEQVGDRRGYAWALLERASLHLEHGATEQAGSDCDRAARLFESLDDLQGRAAVAHVRGDVARRVGNAETAHACFAEAARLFRLAHDAWNEANALVAAAEMSAALGRADEARVLAEEARKRAVKSQNQGALERVEDVVAKAPPAPPRAASGKKSARPK